MSHADLRPDGPSGAGPWGGWRRSAAIVVILGACLALGFFYLTGDDEPALEPPVAATASTPSSGGAAPGQLVYLALGDSLSRGVQPDDSLTLKGGYPRLLQQSLAAQIKPAPKLVEAGCGGATTESMIAGGKACAPDAPIPYANENRSSSQLIWAVQQLEARRDEPTLVTLSVGGNDVTGCVNSSEAKVERCLDDVIPELKRNWKVIARRLRAAAGPKTTLAVATNYDPVLAYVSLAGGKDARPAKAFHRAVVRRINPAMRRIFGDYDWQVADLALAMHEGGAIRSRRSRAVAAVCALTWACGRFDVHLNDQGYRVAADVFEASVIDPVAAATGTPMPTTN